MNKIEFAIGFPTQVDFTLRAIASLCAQVNLNAQFRNNCAQMKATELRAIALNSVQLSCVVFQFFDKIQFKPYGTQ